MPALILATKLYIPPPRPKVVSRPRLIERLDEGLGRKLTLISAPAGFGKTTLVSEWVAGSGEPIAWLSLDEGDNDPARFLTYLIAALQTITPQIGAGVLEAIQTSLPLTTITEFLLTTLLNEIAATPDHFILVLDDYHMLDSEPIDRALTFLLEHQPPQMHMVITTREDPSLPLPRYRVRGQLTELRAADLQFTPSEAAEFLNQVMGLNLPAEYIAALEACTEGWIAGLQLAALSMQDREDIPGFIQAFTGSHHFVLDYLMEEVLQQQPASIQAFLLRTSILERLCGPLCDAVLLDPAVSGQETLEFLECANLFIVPLDNKRHWYRYHHLFRDLLKQRLQQNAAALREDEGGGVAQFHKRASHWYEDKGLKREAIQHALAGEDFKRAADIIELAVPEMRRSKQEVTALGWLKALPGELFHIRPILSVDYAWALLACGELEGVEARLQDAERWLNTTADISEQSESLSTRKVVMDEEEFHRLPIQIAIYRAAIALALGNLHDTVKYARRALDLVPEEDHLGHGAAVGLLGRAFWTNGDLEAAHRSYADGMARLQRAGYTSDALGSATALAEIRIAQGRLHEAMTTYEVALRWATAPGAPVLRGTADMYVGMSVLQYEHNDLNAAMQLLLRSNELCELGGLPQNRYRWCVAMARIKEAQGDLEGALNLLIEAERLYISDFFPNVRPVPALTTRVWAALGKLEEAFDWARARSLSATDDLSYLREFEHITLARMLLARYKRDHTDRSIREALGLLERLLRAAEEGGRMGSALEILLLQALAHQALGDIPTALLPLGHALTLAEPEGYVRMFLDEGPGMAQLLREAATCKMMPNYTGKLLAAFETQGLGSAGVSSMSASSPSQPLIEPLSQRELQVLHLFKTDLSGPEIARELMIGLSTVRTHTKSIYSKLNVNNRRAAVNRAVELNLL